MEYKVKNDSDEEMLNIEFYNGGDGYNISRIGIRYDGQEFLSAEVSPIKDLEIDFYDRDKPSYIISKSYHGKVEGLDNQTRKPAKDKNEVKPAVIKQLGQFLADIKTIKGDNYYPSFIFDQNKEDTLTFEKIKGKEINFIGQSLVLIASL